MRFAAIALAGLLAGAGALLLVLLSDHEDQKVVSASLGLLIGWSFIGTGLFAWWRRPANRVGMLMVGVGLTWFLAALAESNSPAVFSTGVVLGNLWTAVLVHMLLAYPTGRLETRTQKGIVIAAYLLATFGTVVVQLFTRDFAFIDGHPRNVFLAADEPDLASFLEAAVQVAGVAIVLVIGFILLHRWRRASPPQRRTMAPVLWTGATLVLWLGLTLATDAFSAAGVLSTVAACVAYAAFIAVPWAYLFGLLRTRWSRAGAIASLLRGLQAVDTHGSLRDALADALGDPSLDLVFLRADRDAWVDAQGRPYRLPAEGDRLRAVTEVVRDGRPIAAFVHDRMLCEEPDLLHSIAAAAALALENDRLAAELRARVAELQASRERILEFGMAERRRLERDLHDGAQQRLVALSLQLGLARARLDDDPATAAALLDHARTELTHALDELRELARGIHPAVLTDRGLGAAIEALADRTPVPVEVALPEERLPAGVEAVAYFVVAESLTNVVKYARASYAEVSVARRNGHAVVEVRDDGVGGAHAGAGTGLRGLEERLSALDGSLRVLSPPGEGTVVRAEVPCASS